METEVGDAVQAGAIPNRFAPGRMRAIGVVACIALGACDGDRGSYVRSDRTTAAPAGMPFVLVVDSPPGPPTAKLLVDGGGPGTVVKGTTYVVDWITVRNEITKRPTVPVPWPAEVEVPTHARAALILETNVLPDLVVLQAFDEVTASGEPEHDPVWELICDGADGSASALAVVDGAVRVDGLGASVTTHRYVTAFAIWHVPTSLRLGGNEGRSDASVSWLFRTSPATR